MSDVVVNCENLTFRYAKPVVLEDVNFQVSKGESLCIIGPNGGGKSTLLKLLLGLLEPTQGRLEIFGQAAKAAQPRLGYVPQSMQFDPLFPITAIDIALMGRINHLGFGRYKKECKAVAMDCLQEVGMADLARRPFSDLSGGQRQRVLIARALACQPDLLLLDEPTANIDLSIEQRFIETLQSLRQKMTILMVTHDLDLVSDIGDSTLCVNRRVHSHPLPLSGDIIREIYSGKRRLEHDRKTRHEQDDHSSCDHD